MAKKPYRTITVKSPNRDAVVQLAEQLGGHVSRSGVVDRRWQLTVECQTETEYDDLVAKINSDHSSTEIQES